MDLQKNTAKRRRAYMMVRMQRAMRRLALAQDHRQEIAARRWVNAWSSAVGNLHFDIARTTHSRVREAHADHARFAE